MIPVSAIPRFENRVNTHTDMADNADIRRAIIGSVPKANEQTKELAKFFGRSSQRETCKAVFDYLKNEMRYVADGETQIIRLPSALLNTRTGDCKSYALFTSAILTNLGIPHHFVMTSYNADPTPSHIYVATDDGCIIDAVWGTFDAEKKPTYRYEVKPNGKMRVKTMTGIGGCGCGCNDSGSCAIGGMGKTRAERKQSRQQRKEVRKEQKEYKKEVGKEEWKRLNKEGRKDRSTAAAIFPPFVQGRSIVLIWLRWNLDGLASKFEKYDRAKLNKTWLKLGGNTFDLAEAIKVGSQKPERKVGLLKFIFKGIKKDVLKEIEKRKKINGVIDPSASLDEVKTVVNDVAAKKTKQLCNSIFAASAATGAAAGAAAGTAVPGAGNVVGGTAGGTQGAVAGAVLREMCEPVISAVVSYGAQAVYAELRNQLDTTPDLPPVKVNDPGRPDDGEETNWLLYGGIAAAAIFLITRK